MSPFGPPSERGEIPLEVGESFRTVLCGYDNFGLPCGWSRPPGYEGNSIRVRVGEPGTEYTVPQRDEAYEGGAQCGDLVCVEIINISRDSAFAKVKKQLCCAFEKFSDEHGNFSDEYQKNLKEENRCLELTGNSYTDARNAVSLGGSKIKSGFAGVTTIVRHAKYSPGDYGRRIPVWLDSWYMGRMGRYAIKAHPLNDKDRRDVRKEIWVAECCHFFEPSDSEISYGWVYNRFRGFPKNLDYILYFDGPDHMLILNNDGKTDISGRDPQRVVDDFYSGTDPKRFRLVVASEGFVPMIENVIADSSHGLTAQKIPFEISM